MRISKRQFEQRNFWLHICVCLGQGHQALVWCAQQIEVIPKRGDELAFLKKFFHRIFCHDCEKERTRSRFYSLEKVNASLRWKHTAESHVNVARVQFAMAAVKPPGPSPLSRKPVEYLSDLLLKFRYVRIPTFYDIRDFTWQLDHCDLFEVIDLLK